jgi:hypothetical protein
MKLSGQVTWITFSGPYFASRFSAARYSSSFWEIVFVIMAILPGNGPVSCPAIILFWMILNVTTPIKRRLMESRISKTAFFIIVLR